MLLLPCQGGRFTSGRWQPILAYRPSVNERENLLEPPFFLCSASYYGLALVIRNVKRKINAMTPTSTTINQPCVSVTHRTVAYPEFRVKGFLTQR